MPSYGGNYTGLGLDMAVGSHLRHYKQLQQRMDARKTKAESITLRKDWLRAQKRANYQGEYDRIRGLLSQTILPAFIVFCAVSAAVAKLPQHLNENMKLPI